ncbi:uncharacterized protein LOC124653995 isoform X2 [Lolium rigidum]|uniref:uncharacterized protein LOC124653995 isoform X2 n=1 Tax=Lolium rigidum TaxID=89674 RepID=UPI001F5D1D77|nr:uncharacterized protein LOC124653995 isoform X2 [Lolium rigidum]
MTLFFGCADWSDYASSTTALHPDASTSFSTSTSFSCRFTEETVKTVGTTERLNCSSRSDICMSIVFPIVGLSTWSLDRDDVWIGTSGRLGVPSVRSLTSFCVVWFSFHSMASTIRQASIIRHFFYKLFNVALLQSVKVFGD